MTPVAVCPSAMTQAPVSVAASITAAGLNRLAYTKHVGEHEASFGIGVDDLDVLAVRRLHDVARLHRFAGRHVRRRANETHDVDRKFQPADRFHRPEHAGRAAHVELHPLHALRRLDGDAAAVEAESFADEHDRRGVLRRRRRYSSAMSFGSCGVPCATQRNDPIFSRSISARPSTVSFMP